MEALFTVIEASEAETLLDFSGNWKKAVRQMASALQETDRGRERRSGMFSGHCSLQGRRLCPGTGQKERKRYNGIERTL